MNDSLNDSVNGGATRAGEMDVDGRTVPVPADPTESLARALRRAGRTGTHIGCANGDCGACTVLIDGEAFKSCIVPAWRAEQRSVRTIQGLAPVDGDLNRVQQAFRSEDGFQCGFCLAGPVMCLQELVDGDPEPSDDAVRSALAGNLCRCTGYQQILRAARAAVSTGPRPTDRAPAGRADVAPG
ncbi:(2Fe-2S)-binding protein [Pseudonocardia ailaonensis]|uniref:(2Fe-2S)-binding protein n=1 Tax=Pseudonocardia ailaonensis TaxID=367279 RepID=A0ABN2MIG5_9PSEU